MCLDIPFDTKKSRFRPVPVTTLISIQFQWEPFNPEEVTRLWELWASRNPSTNFRAFEVGRVLNVHDQDYFALNAFKIRWTPGYQHPNLQISVKSLAMDFCSERALDGVAFQLQADTYLENQLLDTDGTFGPKLIDRCAVPLKVFPEPMAELKMKEKRLKYLTKANLTRREKFMFDPVFFKIKYVADLVSKESLDYHETPPMLVLYVRQDSDDIFTPMVCCPGNLSGFIFEFSRKYHVDPHQIRGLFKLIGNHHLTNIDDTLFANFSNKLFKMKVVTVPTNDTTDIYDILLSDE